MSFFTRLGFFLLSVIVTLTSFPFRTTSERAKDFRVTAYAVGNNFVNEEKIDASHFEDLTDVILIGIADFGTDGEIYLSSSFDKIYTNLRNAMKNSEANLYLNIIGPGSVTSSPVWEDQMKSMGERHSLAFSTGKLENNIKDVLDRYGFDGIFFDYEYPVTKKHWADFDRFLVSLDKTLGDGYKIGAAISAWHTEQSRKGIAVLDMVEVMAYDLWDNDGTHASLKGAKSCIRQMILNGYKKEQMDLGIPFYARPVTQEAYWYSYSGWYSRLDKKGFCYDEDTGLTFSFNTYDMVYEKTQWAIAKGLGGAMVWHYSCDVPKSNELSLFNAICNAKQDLIKK